MLKKKHCYNEDYNGHELVDIELLDKILSDDLDALIQQYKIFYPEIDFKKPHFNLKVGDKFRNLQANRLRLVE